MDHTTEVSDELMSSFKNAFAFIDGANFYTTCRNLNYRIDFAVLRKFMMATWNVKRVNYYTALVENNQDDPIRKLIDYLNYNGYNMILKQAKTYDNDNGIKKIKGNMDIEIAVDVLTAGYNGMDHCILFTGDGDFRYLVDTLQRMNVFVTVISSIQTQPSMCGDELRRQVDVFIELADFAIILDAVNTEEKLQ